MAQHFSAQSFEQAIAGTAAAYLVMRVLDPHFAKGRWEQKIVSVTKPEEHEDAGTE